MGSRLFTGRDPWSSVFPDRQTAGLADALVREATRDIGYTTLVMKFALTGAHG